MTRRILLTLNAMLFVGNVICAVYYKSMPNAVVAMLSLATFVAIL